MGNVHLMQFPDCFVKAHLASSFAGIEMSQAWHDLALWEEFFNRANVRSVVELGTFKGGMAMFFTLQGQVRGFSVATIDHADHGAPSELLRKFGTNVLSMDLLSETAVEPMQELFDSLPKPLVLFCDNGDKPREWSLFVPLLSPGDFAAVHDWGSEFGEGNLTPKPSPFMQEECEKVESMTRFFAV